MSVIYENTVICKNTELENFKEMVLNTGRVRDFTTAYEDLNKTILTFDSNGDLSMDDGFAEKYFIAFENCYIDDDPYYFYCDCLNGEYIWDEDVVSLLATKIEKGVLGFNKKDTNQILKNIKYRNFISLN